MFVSGGFIEIPVPCDPLGIFALLCVFFGEPRHGALLAVRPDGDGLHRTDHGLPLLRTDLIGFERDRFAVAKIDGRFGGSAVSRLLLPVLERLNIR